MAKEYADKLKDPRWQKKRLQVLERDNFTCKYCSDGKTELHVHHLKYSGAPWDVDLSKLETVCKHCHSVLETIKSTVGEFNVLSIRKYPARDLGPSSLIQLFVFGVNKNNVEFLIIYTYDSDQVTLCSFIIVSDLEKFISENRVQLLKING
jgi:hypothetical protein